MKLGSKTFGKYRPKYRFVSDIFKAVCGAIMPVEQLTVSQAATRYRYLNNPGAYVGPWLNEKTPYLVEVMDVLTSDEYDSCILVGPSQVGKTDIFLNWVAHTVMCDPSNMAIVHMSEKTGREFAFDKIHPFLRHSDDVGQQVLGGRNNLNVFDVRFKSGMRLLIWLPSAKDLSGKTLSKVWLTDYDRMDDNIDGEGDAFGLAKRRTTIYKMHGMTVAESSPGRDVEKSPDATDPKMHEAPRASGILRLYNQGDRRRRYWFCPACGHPFEPDFHHLWWPDSDDRTEASEAVVLRCPNCAVGIRQQQRQDIDQRGVWVKGGQTLTADGEIIGKGIRSKSASFWIKGVIGFSKSWPEMVKEYLDAMEHFELTGDDSPLCTTINTNQGLPYTPPSIANNRLPEDVKARAYRGGAREVPEGVRFLLATIDVQKNRFEVQVHGVGERGDIWVIDRFAVRNSKRIDEDGRAELVDPATYLEDWFLLIDEVMLKTYPLGDNSGRRMAIKLTASDSAGRKARNLDDGSPADGGVTEKAYNFWRWLRDDDQRGLHRRFQLLKGGSNNAAARVELRFPDSERKDRNAGARGEIPVLFMNTLLTKDALDAMFNRKTEKGGKINYPDWLPDSWFKEVTAEVRETKKWKKQSGRANEAWDLLAYCLALTWSASINIEMIDWTDPPSWAGEWDKNDFVIASEGRNPVAHDEEDTFDDLEALGDALA